MGKGVTEANAILSIASPRPETWQVAPDLAAFLRSMVQRSPAGHWNRF